MRYGIGHLPGVDKPAPRGAVVKTADFLGGAGCNEWVHRVERPLDLGRVSVLEHDLAHETGLIQVHVDGVPVGFERPSVGGERFHYPGLGVVEVAEIAAEPLVFGSIRIANPPARYESNVRFSESNRASLS